MYISGSEGVTHVSSAKVAGLVSFERGISNGVNIIKRGSENATLLIQCEFRRVHRYNELESHGEREESIR